MNRLPATQMFTELLKCFQLKIKTKRKPVINMLEDDFSFPIQMCSSAPTKQFFATSHQNSTIVCLFETFQKINVLIYSLAVGDVIWATVQKYKKIMDCTPRFCAVFLVNLYHLPEPTTILQERSALHNIALLVYYTSANANVCKHYATLCTTIFCGAKCIIGLIVHNLIFKWNRRKGLLGPSKRRKEE
jgi:hypothetical protein